MEQEGRDDVVELVLRARRGDRAAMEEVAAEATRLATRLVGAWSGRCEDEGDIVQAVVTDVFLSLGRLDDPARFRAWVARIAECRTMDFLRRKYAEAEREPIQDGFDLDRLSRGDSPESFLEPILEEQRQALEAAIETLPEKYGTVLRLTLRNGLGLPEIAAELDLPVNTVRTRYYRGVKRLNRRMERRR